ncbi:MULTISPECIES: Hsp70 family protein [Aquabacterium]|uniref:Hsp70 family protein n=1 Tax=Aquabacterium TaxID=92793 RepID=UPI001F2EE034|nr:MULTISPECIES: Hsp70 family protein [Aquabacterium]
MTRLADMNFCAIDFGTSNSAIAIEADSGMRLVPLEGEQLTMPTAVFYCTDADDLPPSALPGPGGDDTLPRCFGRAAVQAYIDGYEGRLMRSMKSVLGTALIDQTTEVGQGLGVRYLDIVTGYLRHLRNQAEKAGGQPLKQVVLGRPVYFVDDEPERDAAAQASLEAAARAVGFTDIAFQFEPIAAAFDFEQHCGREEHVLVADIGGGTSDFSVVRVGPERAQRTERRDDILANHGIHIAGTDFDRHLSLARIMPMLGLGGFGPSVLGQPPRPVPSRVYFDLTTWHLINTVYQPSRVAELRNMVDFYGEPAHHRRLMKVVSERLGHALVGRAEAAKIAVAEGGATDIDLGLIEAGLHNGLDAGQADQALRADLERIVACARDTVQQAGLKPEQLGALYFTGGSTGLKLLTDALQAAFPGARAVRGDRLASVATGLGLYAKRLFTA